MANFSSFLTEPEVPVQPDVEDPVIHPDAVMESNDPFLHRDPAAVDAGVASLTIDPSGVEAAIDEESSDVPAAEAAAMNPAAIDEESSDDPAAKGATMNDQTVSKHDTATDQASKAECNKTVSQDVSADDDTVNEHAHTAIDQASKAESNKAVSQDISVDDGTLNEHEEPPQQPSDTEIQRKAADDRSNTELGHGAEAAKKRGRGSEDSGMHLISELRKNGNLCVEFKSKGNDWYYFCTLCNYSTTLEMDIRGDFCDDKGHKSMVRRLQYSMLIDARPWPFNDGFRFFNSWSEYNRDVEVLEEDVIFEFSHYSIRSYQVGVGRIFQRIEVTKAQRDQPSKFLWTRNTWCEWLGMNNQEIPTEPRYTNYPVAILAFLHSSPILDRTIHETQMTSKCSICQKHILHERHCATLVNNETNTLLCSAVSKTDPHLFHVSCLVNWILAVEYHVLKGPDFDSEHTVRNFCPACVVTCTGGRVNRKEMEDVLKTVRQGGSLWAVDFVTLKNNSTGLSFGSFHVSEDTEVKDIARKCIKFYRGLGRAGIPCQQ